MHKYVTFQKVVRDYASVSPSNNLSSPVYTNHLRTIYTESTCIIIPSNLYVLFILCTRPIYVELY